MKIECVEVFGVAVPLVGENGTGVTLDEAKLEKYRFDIKAVA